MFMETEKSHKLEAQESWSKPEGLRSRAANGLSPISSLNAQELRVLRSKGRRRWMSQLRQEANMPSPLPPSIRSILFYW